MTEKQYIIETPHFLNYTSIASAIHGDYSEIINKMQQDYLPWEEFKNKSWATEKKVEIWHLVKSIRNFSNETSIIKDQFGNSFGFNQKNYAEFLHYVDIEMGGSFMGVESFSEGDKKRFIRRNLIEESIASSQIEGANTSRAVAKEMLNQGRSPRNKHEQMIVNNHQTMRWIEEDLKNKELTFELFLELHRKITEKTIDSNHQGILRNTLDKNGKRLVIKPWQDDKIAYVTPDRDFVDRKLPKLIDFANDKDKSGFIHPVIKAIMLHFWVGLLHPFEDGNGRLARIIFYWYLLRKGYWAFSYISISEKILKSANQYAMSYIYSEQDNNDLNYFIHYNINKLKQARESFKKYISEKIVENNKINLVIKKGLNLNSRQINLLHYLVKDENNFITLKSYELENSLAKQTAIKDIKVLLNQNLVRKIKNGRNTFYYSTEKTIEVFK